MKYVVRRATSVGYKRLAKPLLFRRPPDWVHENLIRTSAAVDKVPGVRTLPQLWAYRSPRLEQDVFGLHFANPVGLSAGFDKNSTMARLMKRVGFGYMIGGSVTAEVCAGNPKPWFHRLPHSKSLMVHVGLANQGIARIAERLAAYPQRMFDNFPLSVSVAKTNNPENVSDEVAIDDYCQSLRTLEDGQLSQLYEINISCPNTYGGEPFTTPERLERLLAAVDKLGLTRPVCIKMPINLDWPEFSALLEVAARHNVRGLTIGNLRKDRDHVDARDTIPEGVQGNLSGKPCQALSTDLIRRTYQQYGDRFVIIGVGGIFSAEDAYEKIRAGASLVALITGMIFEGPQVVGEINAGLDRLLAADGYESVAQAVGADSAHGA